MATRSNEAGSDGSIEDGKQRPTLLTSASPVFRSQTSPALEFCKSPMLQHKQSPVLAFLSPLLTSLASPGLQYCKRSSPVIVSAAFPSLVRQEICTEKIAAQTIEGTEPPSLALPPAVRDAASIKTLEKSLEYIDIDMSSDEWQASDRLQGLVESMKGLWKDGTVRFGGLCLDFFVDYPDSKLTVLAQGDVLVGFLVYKINTKNKKTSVSIRRLAVAPEFRRQGHAGRLMLWCLRVPRVCYLELTATPQAVPFYKAFGFRKTETWHTGGTAHPDDEPTINQVYMEYHPGTFKGQKKKSKK